MCESWMSLESWSLNSHQTHTSTSHTVHSPSSEWTGCMLGLRFLHSHSRYLLHGFLCRCLIHFTTPVFMKRNLQKCRPIMQLVWESCFAVCHIALSIGPIWTSDVDGPTFPPFLSKTVICSRHTYAAALSYIRFPSQRDIEWYAIHFLLGFGFVVWCGVVCNACWMLPFSVC